MPRARISPERVIEIAKPGYDVDTASADNMLFVSGLSAGRLKYTGDIAVSAYSGFMSDRYRRAIYTFPVPFPKVPIVLVASRNSDGTSYQGGQYFNVLGSGEGRYLPLYTVEIYPDRFELYVQHYQVNASAPFIGIPAVNWRYWVMANPVN